MSEGLGDADLDRLRSNIREELGAQNALAGLGLDDATLDNLAWAVAVNIHYAFDVRWSPKWVQPGVPDHRTEASDAVPGGEDHVAVCLECGWATARNASREEADASHARHRLEMHGSHDEPGREPGSPGGD